MLAGGIAGDGAITEEMAKKKLYKKKWGFNEGGMLLPN